jgi:hypothetical protein
VVGEAPLQWRSGLSGAARLLFITNQSASQRVRVSGPVALFGDARSAADLHRGDEITITRQGDQCVLDVQVQEGDYALLKWG